jgi:hypothetical protein
MNQFFRDYLQNVLLNVERSELSVESSFESFSSRARMAGNLLLLGYNEYQGEIS